jgi:hypothetical protein
MSGYLRPHHIAAMLGVPERRVRLWLAQRRLHGTRAPFGQWRVPVREVDRFVQSIGRPRSKDR